MNRLFSLMIFTIIAPILSVGFALGHSPPGAPCLPAGGDQLQTVCILDNADDGLQQADVMALTPQYAPLISAEQNNLKTEAIASSVFGSHKLYQDYNSWLRKVHGIRKWCTGKFSKRARDSL